MWNIVFPYVAALLPTAVLGLSFFYVIKYIVEGDRRERLAQAKWEAEHGKGSPPPPSQRESQQDR